MASPPPLPPEPVPERAPDVCAAQAPPTDGEDGWTAVWDPNVRTFYFHNKFTNQTCWENPRAPPAPDQPHASKDVEVQGMSTYEKYQYYKGLLENPDQDEASSDEDEIRALNHSQKMSQFDDPVLVHQVNDPQDPSRLAKAEAQGKSYKAQRKQHQQRVSKDQMQHFKELSRARKLKNRLDWLNDEGRWDPRNMRKNKF